MHSPTSVKENHQHALGCAPLGPLFGHWDVATTHIAGHEPRHEVWVFLFLLTEILTVFDTVLLLLRSQKMVTKTHETQELLMIMR